MKFELTAGMAVLERTPSVLESLLDGSPSEWIHRNEGAETWSPFDVVGHLINCDETNWMPRARVILSDGESGRFPRFDRFRGLAENEGKLLRDLLDRFTKVRADNLRALSALNLTPQHLRLTGFHPELGVVTLEQLLATWVAHDLSHLGQIVRVMASQYRDEVGPWRRFLRILG